MAYFVGDILVGDGSGFSSFVTEKEAAQTKTLREKTLAEMGIEPLSPYPPVKPKERAKTKAKA